MGDTQTQWPEWTQNKPTEPGIYLFRDAREWAHRVITISYGSWVAAQDPNALYAGSLPLSQLYIGYWLGPIPKSPGL